MGNSVDGLGDVDVTLWSSQTIERAYGSHPSLSSVRTARVLVR